ncbi:MAG TPA: KUP/HAK/KT family potassium transporter, partial [Longimicrobiales bacterium]|nr:KUP/HAK/KT family potassium transporter [Longimicrobiales bacterium]
MAEAGVDDASQGSTPASPMEDGGVWRRRTILSVGALGVVFGDIGTSPLYAVRECFFGPYGVDASRANVLGVLSLITWSLILVISIKYLAFVLRADNDGEGGILALMELVRKPSSGRLQRWALGVGLFGAALLYGDGMITPAISVLSAMEGLEVATPAFASYVVPLTIGILLVLFALQRMGTGGVGRIFGPIMLLWFAVLAVSGLVAVVRQPFILTAVDPRHGLGFLTRHGATGLTILGVVFLVVTGGEALYADIGHFGKAPIRLAWFSVAFPCLLLNYFGQGSVILSYPGQISNPFYQMVPGWAIYPMVVLAAVATIIASQAIISGVFSLTFQGMKLGYLPFLNVRHTSAARRGRIYVPVANWVLLVATVGLVVGFRRSGNLAAAYGVAIATTMVVTSVLFFFAMRMSFGWPLWVSGAVTAVFLVGDTAFFLANI